jgi:hypothetical protein
MNNVRRLRRPSGNNAAPAGRRLRANWPAEIRVNGERKPCTVIDVSSGGAHLRLPHVTDGSATVWLIIDNAAPIPAAVAWRDKGRTGLRFSEEHNWVTELTRQRFDPTAWIEA